MHASSPASVETLRCAIYTRKSTDRGLEREINSLDAQRETCSAYIKSQRHRGWLELPRHYDDGGQSGGNLDRPALQNLMEDIEGGHVDVVVIYKIDRLTRSLADFVRLIDHFDRYEVAFVSITQAFDTSDSMGRLVLNVLLTFAQFERELIGDRIRDRFATLRRRGKWTGGLAPLGYDLVEGKLRVNPAEATLVREIFDQYPLFPSGNRLLQHLRKCGARSKIWVTKQGVVRGGFPVCSGLLHRVLKNPTYLGVLAYDGEWYPGEHDAIISREQWDRAQEARRQREGNRLVQSSRGNLLLGFFFDSFGRRMKLDVVPRSEGVYRYYRSERVRWGRRKHIAEVRCSADDAEEVIVSGIQSFLRDRPALADVLADSAHFDHRLRRRLDAGEVAARRIERFSTVDRRHLLLSLARRIELAEDHVRVILSIFELSRLLSWDGVGCFRRDDATPRSQLSRVYTLRIPASLWRSRRELQIPLAPQVTEEKRPKVNQHLVRLLEKAWTAQLALYRSRDLTIADLARKHDCTPGFFARLVRLNYLAPDITTAILDGRQPPRLTRRRLAFVDLPMDWAQQRQLLGFPPVNPALDVASRYQQHER